MNRIFETIVTLRGADGRTHITPLGVRYQDSSVLLAPFRPSATLDLLLQSRVAVVNCTDDVRVFAGCIVGRRDWPLAPATRVDGVRLASCLAHDEIELTDLIDDVQRPRLQCRSVHRETHARQRKPVGQRTRDDVRRKALVRGQHHGIRGWRGGPRIAVLQRSVRAGAISRSMGRKDGLSAFATAS